jgi:ornithine cyclodeaminase/alanine dehydrogenase-like protein (mu-crystallin family)
MARPDATKIAILGSGWQAGAQVLAAATIRPLTQIHCYSPNPQSRHQFAVETEVRTGVPARACSSAKEAVRDADMVLCATNSLRPVLDRQWLRKGMHVSSIRDREIPSEAMKVVDRIVIHDAENMKSDHLVLAKGVEYPEQTKEIASDPELRKVAEAPNLADLVTGTTPGRRDPQEITCFLNYHGLGCQFAAVGAVLYQKALAAGRGQKLPSDWFTETVHP